MNYLINPLWIYFIDVLVAVDMAALIAFFVGSFTVVCLGAFWLIYEFDSLFKDDIEKKNVFKKLTIISSVVTVVALVICLLVPSEKTMYTMLVANYATEENLEEAGQTIEEMVDYIFEKVDELQND